MAGLNAEYVSDQLFPLFANRILAKSRPEYDDYLTWLGMSHEKYDSLDELEQTGGLRATDSLEIFSCPQLTMNQSYELFFFGRGLRHLHAGNPECVAELKPGDRLYLMQDVQNKHDEQALLLRTDDPVTLVGYAPHYFSAEFSQLLTFGAKEVKVVVEKVNLDAPLQYRLLCRIVAPWPVNFQPCQTELFEPLATGS